VDLDLIPVASIFREQYGGKNSSQRWFMTNVNTWYPTEGGKLKFHRPGNLKLAGNELKVP